MADGELTPGPSSGDGLYQLLLSEFAAILKVAPEAIDPTKSFDSYGLDSIDSVIATDRLGECLERELAPEFLLQHRNLAEVVAALSGTGGEAGNAPPGAPVFLFDGAGGRSSALNKIADHCPADMEFARVRFGGWPEWIGEGFSFERLTERICDDIERRSPSGPIILAGYSQGGLMAFAAAMQLVARQRRVDALILFDTSMEILPRAPNPNHDLGRLFREPALWGKLAMSAVDLLLSRGDHPSRGFGTARTMLVFAAYRRVRSRPRARRVLVRLERGWGRLLFRGQGGAKLDLALQKHLFSELWQEWYARASKGWQLSATTVLLRAAGVGEPDHGWRRFCTACEVIPVAGDHGTMHAEENIGGLAAEFAAIVGKAGTAGGGFS